MMSYEDNYTTSDMGFAASLLAMGFQIDNVDKSNSRRVVFAFQRSESLDAVVSKYRAGELLIPTNSVIESIKNLKSLIYE